MEKNYTEKDLIEKVSEAHKQRGKYLAYIVGELERAGFKDFDEALKKAIFRFGRDKAAKWGRISARDFMNRMMDDEIGKGTFGFEEVGAGTEERTEFIFRRCPLEEGWKEMGLSALERHRLCSIAREHDFGLVENKANQDLRLEMPESIGRGNPLCRIILSKKK